MAELVYEKVKQDDQNDTLLGIITRDKSKKTRKEYEERLLAAYDMVEEKRKHVDPLIDLVRESYKHKCNAYMELGYAVDRLPALRQEVLESIADDLKQVLPSEEVDEADALFKDYRSIDDVDKNKILSFYKEDILDTLSPQDEEERSIYGRCIDSCVSNIVATTKDENTLMGLFGFGGFLGGGIAGGVILGIPYGPEGVPIILCSLGVGMLMGMCVGNYLDGKEGRWKMKKMIKKQGFLDELMELE